MIKGRRELPWSKSNHNTINFAFQYNSWKICNFLTFDGHSPNDVEILWRFCTRRKNKILPNDKKRQYSTVSSEFSACVRKAETALDPLRSPPAPILRCMICRLQLPRLRSVTSCLVVAPTLSLKSCHRHDFTSDVRWRLHRRTVAFDSRYLHCTVIWHGGDGVSFLWWLQWNRLRSGVLLTHRQSTLSLKMIRWIIFACDVRWRLHLDTLAFDSRHRPLCLYIWLGR